MGKIIGDGREGGITLIPPPLFYIRPNQSHRVSISSSMGLDKSCRHKVRNLEFIKHDDRTCKAIYIYKKCAHTKKYVLLSRMINS